MKSDDSFVDKNTWYPRRPSTVSGVGIWGHVRLRETKRGRLSRDESPAQSDPTAEIPRISKQAHHTRVFRKAREVNL